MAVAGYKRQVADTIHSLCTARPPERTITNHLGETISVSENDVLLSHATAPMAFRGLPVSPTSYRGGEVEPQIKLVTAMVNILARKAGIKNIITMAQVEMQQTEHDEAVKRFEEDRLIKKNTLENEPKIAKFIEDKLRHHTTFVTEDGRLIEDPAKVKCFHCGVTISLTQIAAILAKRYRFGGVFNDDFEKSIERDLYGQGTVRDVMCTNPECWSKVFRFVRFLPKDRKAG